MAENIYNLPHSVACLMELLLAPDLNNPRYLPQRIISQLVLSDRTALRHVLNETEDKMIKKLLFGFDVNTQVSNIFWFILVSFLMESTTKPVHMKCGRF